MWKRYAKRGQRVVYVTLTTGNQRGNVTLNVGKALFALR